MAQITHGIRSILSHPRIYSLFQSIMGAHQARHMMAKNYIKPRPGMDVLDIGCGPAEILDYMPSVGYWGFDISQSYIEQATKRYGNRGQFTCKELTADDLNQLPKFDIVLALGLMHHLNDQQAEAVLTLAHLALKPGGRLVTVDPCLVDGQNPIARFLILHDRGQNVRSQDAYVALAGRVFSKVNGEVRHKAWIPYTHCFMECTR